MEVYKWRHQQRKNGSSLNIPQLAAEEMSEAEKVQRFLAAEQSEPAVRRSPRHTPLPASGLKQRNVKLPP
jgi:hypothetical protein